MSTILSIGLLIMSGYFLGELAEKVKLPKISGYILAGILLNPDLSGIMSIEFIGQTDALLTISLSLITFSIGGSLSLNEIKRSGRKILILVLFESMFAFLFVFVFCFIALKFFLPIFESISVILAVSLVLASLAAPTDPSATLAVIHEYSAKGTVSSTMLNIAAFDDVTGIIIYTLVTGFSAFLMGDNDVNTIHIVADLFIKIAGGIGTGILLGLLFRYTVKLFKKQAEGSLIVITFGLVFLSYGISNWLGFDALLSTMALGATVVNFNPFSDKIFNMVERYTDELIFVIFFSLSGLHLHLSSIQGSLVLIFIYIIARIAGKYSGIFMGAKILNSDKKIKKYAAGGLIPQGGIVIGLALLISKNSYFVDVASVIIGIVIGSALIHELVGPIFSRSSLKSAGEI